MDPGHVIGGQKDGLRTNAYGLFAAKGELQPVAINRRYPLKPHDILIKIAYCGICHTDISCIQNDWGYSSYPMVPGHEITGFVKEIGSEVTRFKVGEKCGVGGVSCSCGNCRQCKMNEDNYCPQVVFTYNYPDPINEEGRIAYGGLSTQIVVNEQYVLKWPDNLPMDKGAPLLGAGVTVYSPLRLLNVGPGTRLGVAGLGGLGHIAVRLAHEMGAFVCVFSRGKWQKKRELAKKLGADMFIETDGVGKIDCGEPLDIILDTIDGDHDINSLVELLQFEGTYVVLGTSVVPPKLMVMPFISARRKLFGSMLGSTEECQQLLDYCAQRGIACMTHNIPVQDINAAIKKIIAGDVYFRVVVDINASKWGK